MQPVQPVQFIPPASARVETFGDEYTRAGQLHQLIGEGAADWEFGQLHFADLRHFLHEFPDFSRAF